MPRGSLTAQEDLFGHERKSRGARRRTSDEAEDYIRDRLGRLELMVFGLIESMNRAGATCDECERRLGLKHQTCSARITALNKTGWIEDSGKRRKTNRGKGRNAIVWTATPKRRRPGREIRTTGKTP